ncbi:MAG TPA: bacteriohemerythrin, partial [Xanthobacteraceae bacterium]|nr:bacteriohemerythrin [Xanthobacteraceae bacterium]
AKWALADILDELIRYTRSHFAFEEDMLQKQGYSQLPAHHAVHEGLTAQVCELRDRFQSGKLAISMEVLRFLKDWLADHILRHDKDYAKELSGK